MTNDGIFPRILQLPVEIRLEIYKHAISSGVSYIDRSLIVISTALKSNKHSVLTGDFPDVKGSCDSFKTVWALSAVNTTMYDEVSALMCPKYTPFFSRSFNITHLDHFFTTLGRPLFESCHTVGFDICLIVHEPGCVKQPLRGYLKTIPVLERNLPHWDKVILYLNPDYYDPNIPGLTVAKLDQGIETLITGFTGAGKRVFVSPKTLLSKSLREKLKSKCQGLLL